MEGDQAEHVKCAGMVGIGGEDGAEGDFGLPQAAGFEVSARGVERFGHVGTGHGCKVSRGWRQSHPKVRG